MSKQRKKLPARTPTKKRAVKPPTKDAAASIVERANISEIELLECSAKNNGADRRSPPKIFAIGMTNNAVHQVIIGDDKKKVGEKIVVTISVTIEAREKAEDVEPKLAITTKHRVSYSLAKGRKVTERQLTAFGAYYVSPVVWPYISEFAHRTSMLMGLPALRMPIFEHGALSIAKN